MFQPGMAAALMPPARITQITAPNEYLQVINPGSIPRDSWHKSFHHRAMNSCHKNHHKGWKIDSNRSFPRRMNWAHELHDLGFKFMKAVRIVWNGLESDVGGLTDSANFTHRVGTVCSVCWSGIRLSLRWPKLRAIDLPLYSFLFAGHLHVSFL